MSALNASRFDDACDARLASRQETSVLLKQIVNLEDIFPDSDAAEDYTDNRSELVDKWRDELTREDCA